jgi:hypothetical protein
MTRRRTTIALTALTLSLASGLMVSPALAQPPGQAAGAPLVGAEIKDSKGKAVGRIERVINGADGKPAQVLVRVDRVLRTLPAEAMTPSGAGYISVLSRAEIAALPPSD